MTPVEQKHSFPVRVFQYPGNVVADLLHATAEDDRVALRVLVDMLFWNIVVVLVAIVIGTVII